MNKPKFCPRSLAMASCISLALLLMGTPVSFDLEKVKFTYQAAEAKGGGGSNGGGQGSGGQGSGGQGSGGQGSGGQGSGGQGSGGQGSGGQGSGGHGDSGRGGSGRGFGDTNGENDRAEDRGHAFGRTGKSAEKPDKAEPSGPGRSYGLTSKTAPGFAPGDIAPAGPDLTAEQEAAAIERGWED